jgi:para-nitrobenzyl esterase
MTKKTRLLIPCFFLGSLFLLQSFSWHHLNNEDLKMVKVEGGIISGTTNEKGTIHIFKGIPYAAAPVGELRWKKPQPVKAWVGIKKCVNFGASPMQDKPAPFGPWSEEYLIPKEPISEDCLYLNVWSGASNNKEKRPVLVWIYGGGFSSGGSAVPIYDGEAMAKKGIVFVSINYRVGIFGFFAHPELTKESGNNASGNYGLMDQVAALNWVQKNINAFGGDPNNVTIAGQSAGSMSVNCLVASPLCKGLFKKAIAESGASFVSSPAIGIHTLAQAEENGNKLAQSLHANSIKELRDIPAADLLKKQQTIFRGPIVDGYVLPHSIAEIFAAGEQNDIALMTGWNENDGVVFGPPATASMFKDNARKMYGDASNTFLQLYPANDDAEAANSAAKLSRDLIFGIQNYTWANKQADKSKYKVYVYRFERKLPAEGDYKRFGAFHTGEVAYAYGNLSFVHRCPWEAVDHELEKTMLSYWANFISTGNPNGKNLPEWKSYNTKEYPIMVLDEKPETKPLPDKENLDFLLKYMK